MESYEKKQLIYKFIFAIVFVVCITIIVTFFATITSLKNNSYPGFEKELSRDDENSINTISRKLKSFRKIINEYYIGDIDEDKIVDETIKGYINGLDDEYSEYMTEAEWDDYQANALGNYVGIGIYMSKNSSGDIVVVEPIEESPAEEVGIMSGDIIVEVDGESTINMDTSEVATKVKGEEGTKVNLKLLRENEYFNFEVERKAIKVYHVKNKMLDNNIGYIKLSTFDEDCSIEFQNSFNELQNKGAKKLIIDLRDNTGGLVDESLKIADFIVEKDKTLLLTIDSKDKKETTISKHEPIVNMDVVVLVNEYSASASEILVGALKDNKEATIVGKKTYGKGVIQNVISMGDGSVLKLTTAEYFTPNETKINKLGITPDVEVEQIKEEKDQEEIDEQLNKAIELLK